MITRQTLRRTGFSALLLAFCVGGALYYMKHYVSQMKARLAYVNKEMMQTTEAMHVLRAEWGYLNQPERLKTLNTIHANLQPVEVVQLASLDDFMSAPVSATGTMLASLK